VATELLHADKLADRRTCRSW